MNDFLIENGILIRYLGPGGDVLIPEGVTSIRRGAFDTCDTLTAVRIPEGVTLLGAKAFRRCRNLRAVTFPESLRAIEHSAFHSCHALQSIVLPQGLKDIGDEAFLRCYALRWVTIPPNVSRIGRAAFLECKNLTELVIPESVRQIGDYAFRGCESLEKVHISNYAAWVEMEKGNMIHDDPLPLYWNGRPVDTSQIPPTVKRIGSYAFEGRWDLTDIAIPEGVLEIGRGAFSNCRNLECITIPQGVTVIENCAFLNCERLAEIHVPDSVESIGSWAFRGCHNVTLPIGDIQMEKDSLDGAGCTLQSYISVCLFQKGKWVDRLLGEVELPQADFASEMLVALDAAGKVQQCTRWMDYVTNHFQEVPEELLLSAKFIFEKKKAKKALTRLEQMLARRASGGAQI